MKKLIIILAFVLLLAGAGAWWYFFFNEEKIDLAEMTPFSEAVPLFVDFDPLVLPIIRDGQVTQHLTFTIILEVSSDLSRIQIFYHKRRLNDAYLRELHGLYSHRLVQDRPNVEPFLGKRLLEVSRQVLGTEKVNRVLVSILDRKDLLNG